MAAQIYDPSGIPFFAATGNHDWGFADSPAAEILYSRQSASWARWKIVYGHHPIYSYGVHGDTPELKQGLLPVLKNRAHIYLVWHDHLVQHLKPEGGVHFFVVPAAGQDARPVKTGPLTLYADPVFAAMYRRSSDSTPPADRLR